MKQQILDLAKKLIEIPSTADNPAGKKQVVELAKKEVREFFIEDFDQNNAPSFLASNREHERNFKVILNAHLDIVPGREEQYHPIVENDRLIGRGSIDMKAAAAVEMLVFKEVAPLVNYPLGLQIVSDEETGGFHGTKHQVDEGIRAEFVIAGEHTNFGVNNKAKGVLWVRVNVEGQSGHAAYPWKAENALWKGQLMLEELRQRFPLPQQESWVTTVNLARIETDNTTFNKIPESAVYSFDIRFIPEEQETIEATIRKIMEKYGKVEILEKEHAHLVNETNDFIAKLRQTAEKVTGKESPVIVKHGASDVRHYQLVDNHGVTFGPLGDNLHGDNEWVDLRSLEEYYDILKEFLLSL